MNDMVFCRACGHKIHITANACPQCGAIQRTKPLKSRVATVLLAFFLGGLGAHRFYLGQWWGIFYLLLCWTGVPGLVALIEAIVFLARGQQSFDEAYNDGVDSGGSGASAAIIAVVAVVGGIFLIGVLAAIALPAYQEYTHKAKLQEVHSYGQALTGQIADFVETRRRAPAGVSELPSPGQAPRWVAGSEVDQGTGELVLRLGGLGGERAYTLKWRPERAADGRIGWQCHSEDIPASWLPKACR